MQDFKVSKLIIVLQVVLLALLIVLTIQPENMQSGSRMIVLLIADFVLLSFFVSSIFRSVTVDKDNAKLIVKSMFRTITIDIKKLEFAQMVNALGRYVLILNDGNKTATVTSLTAKMGDVLEFVKANAPKEFEGKFGDVTASSMKNIKIKEAAVYIVMIVLVIVAITIKHF